MPDNFILFDNLSLQYLRIMSFKFEKLIVWQKALDLAGSVHELTKGFPKEEFLYAPHKLSVRLTLFR